MSECSLQFYVSASSQVMLMLQVWVPQVLHLTFSILIGVVFEGALQLNNMASDSGPVCQSSDITISGVSVNNNKQLFLDLHQLPSTSGTSK